MSVANAKANAFLAVKNVIEKGRVVLRESSSRRLGVEGIFISAPVEIGGVDDIVTVLVHHDKNTQRMYLHSVTTKKSLQHDRVSGTWVSKPQRSGSSHEGGINSVLRDLINFKENDSASV